MDKLQKKYERTEDKLRDKLEKHERVPAMEIGRDPSSRTRVGVEMEIQCGSAHAEPSHNVEGVAASIDSQRCILQETAVAN